MKTLRTLTLVLLLLWTTVYGLSTTYAAVPHLINYQGQLTDKNGSLLKDGSYTLTFRIYDAENAGNLLWQGTYNNVSITKGIFGILLGDVSDTGYKFDNLAFDKPYFLEFKVGSEVMTPRQRITSVAYAMSSEKAGETEKIKADKLDAAAGYLSEKADNVTIEVNAAHKLQIKDGSLTVEKIANSAAGEAAEVNSQTERSYYGSSYAKIKEISIGRNGNIRVKFQAWVNNPSSDGYVQIYKNDVPIGKERKINNWSVVEYSEDINNVKAGDLIQLYCKNAIATVFVKNFRICVSVPMVSSVSID